ncbi:MAG: RecX family transcriptional regulator [Treponema sp.]|nr:RecX family transcriptional regulator [Treponema sp.]
MTTEFDDICLIAEKAALKLIARAEQNSFRLALKLEQKGFDSAVVKEVISRLLDRNLLNDERFAELWVRSRLSQGKSPRWLFASLRRKGIDRNTSQKALEKVLDSETEYTLLLRHLEKAGISENGDVPRAALKSEGFSGMVLDNYYSL